MSGMWTSGDRWTCPECGATEAYDSGDDDAVRAAIRSDQEQHAARHSGDQVKP